MGYNRYSKLNIDGRIRKMPPIKLSEKASDLYETYERNISRLDNLSYKYYNDPNYDWLILLANQDIADMEYDIPDNTIIRIPYPLSITLDEINNKIDAYNVLYGIDN